MDLGIDYLLLPCIFQNSAKISQSQNDLRVIVNAKEDSKSELCLNLSKKTPCTAY